MEDLGAISDDITADGPIDAVVNAAQPLNGIRFSAAPRRRCAARCRAPDLEWIESGRRLGDINIGFFKEGRTYTSPE